jgi:C-terminal processing protease CtpA/Prc
VAALRRERLDATVAAALVSADSVLRRIGPDLGDAVSEVAMLRAHLSSELGEQVADDPRLERLVERTSELQARLAEALAHQVMAHGAMQPQGMEDHAPTPRARVRPAGWLGVNLLGDVHETMRGGDLIVSCKEYPRVESVEPGSPAEAAGLVRGDTILAYNGRDVRSAIVMNKLLTPGARVVIRVRRAGEEQEIPVRVARRPAPLVRVWTNPQDTDFDFQYEFDDTRRAPAPPRSPAPRPALAPAAPPIVRVVPAPPAPAAPVVPDATPLGPMTLIFGGPTTVAGAEVARMNDDLREAFGGARGVLVIGVASGTPAAQAGLRGGDVVMRAGGRSVTTPAALQRALLRASGRELTLDVARKGTTRTVTLKW